MILSSLTRVILDIHSDLKNILRNIIVGQATGQLKQSNQMAVMVESPPTALTVTNQAELDKKHGKYVSAPTPPPCHSIHALSRQCLDTIDVVTCGTK